MIKDNHIAAAGGILPALEWAREMAPHTLRLQVETQTLAQVEEALSGGAEIIMLDNMSDALMEEAIASIRAARPGVIIEASGNMTADRIRGLVALDLDFVSVGALTHSAVAADISMGLTLAP